MSAGGAALMSCVREGSLEPPYRPPHSPSHNHGEGRTGRFLRGLRRMFKRRGSGARADASPDPRSSSTSELLDADRHHRRKEGAYGSGLSVSHDSVFTGERSGDESSDERPTPASLTHAATHHRAELVAAVRRRGRGDGSDDDEDLGLPQSPPASPPTDKSGKRHHAGISQSSCSDGSLLSVGSSEMDEDSSSGAQFSHDHSARSDQSDHYHSSEPPMGVAPLSHSAAKHKMAVRPRRTHGAPRRKKTNTIASALPITPELNEEMLRSTTPDVARRTSEVVTESLSSSSTMPHVKEQHVNRSLQRVLEPPGDVRSKSSSLPPGLALSPAPASAPAPAQARLSLAHSPRSSIKRSKSTTQDQKHSPKVTRDEAHHRSEERMSKYRVDNKPAEETCLERKTKSEKKIENEVIRSSKKEESFFSRLLLRKSGKKSKKDQTDGEGQHEMKKSKTDKSPAQYKPVDAEKGAYAAERREAPGYKPVPAERTHKTAGQKVFANQMHKRIDTKGGYAQEGAYKDVYSAAKVSGLEYNITDLKAAEETDKMLNLETKNRFSRREEFSEKIERTKRTTSKEAIDDRKDSFSLQQDRSKRPTSVQRLVDPFSSKAFISNEQTARAKEESLSPSLETSDSEPLTRGLRIKSHNDYVFHSGSMPKNMPYFNPNIVVSDAPPIKTIRHQSSENVKLLHRSSEHVSDFEKHKIETKRQTVHHTGKTEESFGTALRSLGDEYETRSSIGKSHSFRYASETTSISSQESQLPSLPAIVGISEPLLESWEANYRRNVSDRHDFSKRVSARNYNIMQSTTETYDSLPSTDSSYLDSLKTDVNEDRKMFTNNIHVGVDPHKRDSDISQIEAKIDDIISSPKPIIASMLKSSSLDSVKSSPEKPVEDRRKTISVESSLSQGSSVIKDKQYENFISVTQINREQNPVKTVDTKNKSDDRIPKIAAITTKPGVPEFLNIQLNRVDVKPTTNVVLTANVTPKKLDSPVVEKDQEGEMFKTSENKLQTAQIKRESIVSKFVESVNVNSPVEEKNSPITIRKCVQSIQSSQSSSPPKAFFKRKSTSVEHQDKPEKSRTNSMSTEGSIEKIYDNISMDQKSHSSFGSKSSIQSIDSNENKAAERQEDGVVFRKKHVISKELRSSERKNDNEPELFKVFARRSLKIKDSEAETIAQEIAEATNIKDENNDNVTATRTKILKNEYNASIKSRDSDKENEDIKEQDEKRVVDIAARVSQFGAAKVPHYQRSVSINSVSNPKRESAPAANFRSEVSKYKKEVSDSTPEKRLRNRTFPDPSNDRTDIPITKSEAMAYKADTLTKRPWLKSEFRKSVEEKSAVIENDGDTEKDEGAKEKDGAVEDTSPQYKGILQMRAEWERRAQQAITGAK